MEAGMTFDLLRKVVEEDKSIFDSCSKIMIHEGVNLTEDEIKDEVLSFLDFYEGFLGEDLEDQLITQQYIEPRISFIVFILSSTLSYLQDTSDEIYADCYLQWKESENFAKSRSLKYDCQQLTIIDTNYVSNKLQLRVVRNVYNLFESLRVSCLKNSGRLLEQRSNNLRLKMKQDSVQ